MRRVLALAPLLLLLASCAETEEPAHGLALGAHPDIILPEADMARALPPGALEHAVVLRVGRRSQLSAVRVPTGEELPVPDRESLRAMLGREADRAGRQEDAAHISRLDAVVWADAGAAWQRVVWTLQDCGDRAVRVNRVWIALRDSAGQISVLPCFLPVPGPHDTGFHDPPVQTARVRIGVTDDPAGFEDPERLYAWFHRLRRMFREEAVEVEIAPDAAAPFQRVVDVLNEARRFGVRVSIRGQATGNKDVEAADRGFFRPDGPSSLSALDVTIPPRRPGVALTDDPDASGMLSIGNRSAFRSRAIQRWLSRLEGR